MSCEEEDTCASCKTTGLRSLTFMLRALNNRLRTKERLQ